MAVWCAVAYCSSSKSRTLHTHVLNAWLHQFQPHIDGEGNGDKTGQAAGQKVKDTNVFVIGGHKPARKKPAVIFVIMSVYGCVGHQALPFDFDSDGCVATIFFHLK